MDIEKAIELMKNEMTCVKRQDTPDCCRDECGCQGCDLVVETDEILEAYEKVIIFATFGGNIVQGIIDFMVENNIESVDELDKIIKNMQSDKR